MSCWVSGGVARAAVIGRFDRRHREIDICVSDDEFDRAASVLRQLVEADAALRLGTDRQGRLVVKGDGDLIDLTPNDPTDALRRRTLESYEFMTMTDEGEGTR